MGSAASSHGTRPRPPDLAVIRPKRTTLFSNNNVNSTLGRDSGLNKPPPMTQENVDFLLKIFGDLFCLDKGSEETIQTSLLLDVIRFVAFKEGDYMMKQGENGHEMFIVDNGDVEVIVNEECVRHLRRGAVVGEIAMLYGAPRNASVRCLTNTSCYYLMRQDFKSIQEIASANNVARRTEWMKGLPEFNALGNMELYRLVQALQQVELKRGDVLYEEGALSSRIIIIESGAAEVVSTAKLLDFSEASENALHGFAIHSTSVLADAETREMVDERFPFLKQSAKFSQKYCSFVEGGDGGDPDSTMVGKFVELPNSTKLKDDEETSPLFGAEAGGKSARAGTEKVTPPAPGPVPAPLSAASALPSFCDTPSTFSAGSILGISVIKSKANKEASSTSGAAPMRGAWQWKEQWVVRPDGSEELHCGACPPINVQITSEKANVLVLSLDTVEQIFGPMRELWTELEACVSEGREYVRDVFHDNIVDTMSTLGKAVKVRRRYDAKNFEQLCFIKEDSCGYSTLERYNESDGTFLVKLYSLVHRSKFKNSENSQLLRAVEEINILNKLSNPFVADLAGISVTPDELILVFENLGASDLWSFIYEYSASQEELNMKQVRCLISSIVFGLDHIHKKGISYRELKPENVSIDNLGRIKLCDFGSAKTIPFMKQLPCGQLKIQTKSFTLLGTPGEAWPIQLRV
jgi:CRP-like cAMP-binding protein